MNLLILRLQLSLLSFFLIELLGFGLLFLLSGNYKLGLLISILLGFFLAFLHVFQFIAVLLILIEGLFMAALQKRLLVMGRSLFLHQINLLITH